MKVNKIMNRYVEVESSPMPSITVKEAAPVSLAKPDDNDSNDAVIFPASDRFKHMLKLIARDNKELYNRIIGMD